MNHATLRSIALLAVTAGVLFACRGPQPEPVPADRWVAHELGTRAEFGDIFFLDEDHGWIVGGGVHIEGGIVGRTTDGGRTWAFDSGIARPSPRATVFHLNAVHFLDRKNGFIFGDGYRILRTRDGGKHWHPIKSHTRVWAHMRDLEFVDDTHGWAIGNGGLARTVDGGETWDGPLALDPEAEKYVATRGSALSFVDPHRGWLVGKHGLIRSSNDGGTSWTLLAEPASGSPDLWSVDFVDYRTGWAVGADGTILHTADAGRTWDRQDSGVRDVLMDVEFLDAHRGWVVGFERANGTAVILWTEDGGATWAEQARVPSEEMRSIFVLDERHAWAVGRQQRRGPDDGSQKVLRYEAGTAE